MYENLIDKVADNSTKFLKFVVENEDEAKEIIKGLAGEDCFDREHNRPHLVNYFINGGQHIADYYPATKTLIFRKSYSLRESSEFNENLVSSEFARAIHMAKTASEYPHVKGWAMTDHGAQVEYHRGFGEKGISLVIKKNGNWDLVKGYEEKTLDAGRNATPAKAEKILKQAIKVYG